MYVRGSDKNIEYKRDLTGFFRGIIMSDADPARLYRCRIFIPELHEVIVKEDGDGETKYYTAPDKNGNIQPKDHKRLLETLPWAEQASSLFGEQSLSHYSAFRGSQTGGTSRISANTETPPDSKQGAMYVSQKMQLMSSNTSGDNNPFNPTGGFDVYGPAPNAPSAHGIHGIPSVGAHVWVFFDRGDINCPVYFAACPSAIEAAQVFHDNQYPDLYSTVYTDEGIEENPPEPKDSNSPTNYANGERVPGQQLPEREELKNLTPAEREEFYRLVDSEVGGQGQQARIAFIETVANRAKMNGETIPELIQKDRNRWADYKAGRRKSGGYFDTINTGVANRPLNTNLGGSLNNAREIYDRDFAQVIGGSNISGGATHAASGTVASRWLRDFQGLPGSDHRYGGELFYSKNTPKERRFRQELLESVINSNASSSIIVSGRTLNVPLPTNPSDATADLLPPL